LDGGAINAAARLGMLRTFCWRRDDIEWLLDMTSPSVLGRLGWKPTLIRCATPMSTGGAEEHHVA
jgi:hypothetical protein